MPSVVKTQNPYNWKLSQIQQASACPRTVKQISSIMEKNVRAYTKDVATRTKVIETLAYEGSTSKVILWTNIRYIPVEDQF